MRERTTWARRRHRVAARAATAVVLVALGIAAVSPAENQPDPIEPLHVRPLAGLAPGSNDSNPAWSPGGSLIAFERSRGDGKEIVIVRPDGTLADTIYHQGEGGGERPFLLPGDSGEESYNAGISWSPSGKRFVFMSNGGEGNYDLFLRDLGGRTATRLTDHKEKDGHAHWSPAADNLVVFVSGRTGKGDLYFMDVSNRTATRLTPGGTKIAFSSNYNPAGDPNVWSILVVASDGTDPGEGEGLAAKVVAEDVIPDVETGPAWMPDSAGIVYVKNDRQEHNPIYIVDFKSGTERPVGTGTQTNP